MSDADSIEHYDVAVVGYGPTGIVLASVLGQAGHKVAVVERFPTLFNLPRLTHIDGETARIVQMTANVDDALANSDTIHSYSFYNGEGELLTRVGSSEVDNSGFPKDISIFQPDIDAAIDARVQSCPNVTRILGFEAIGFRQDADGVDLDIAPARGEQGEARTIRAKYVAGCDGARSAIREGVEVERIDLGFNERWLNVDTKILRPLAEKFLQTTQVCDPRRGHMYMPIGKKHMRFELAVLPGENEEDFLKTEFAWKWLREMHDIGPEDVEIIRHIVYTFMAHIAQQWRFGRVFLGGDAAHTTPPYLGQGACGGMRDGLNLGWKLDLVLRGLADENILDTYFVERCPHVTKITKMAIGLGEVANTHDPEKARQRDEAMRSHAMPAPVIPGLTGGMLLDGDALAGTIGLQREVTINGRSGLLDSVVGNGFTLISRQSADQYLDQPQIEGLDRIGAHRVALTDFDAGSQAYQHYFDEAGIDAVLVRPDFYVFGSARTMSGCARLADALLAMLGGNMDVGKTKTEEIA